MKQKKKYIEQFNTYNTGLNSTIGGEGCLGYTHSSEIRQKISENTKNGNSHKGKTYEELYGDKAEEQREKRILSLKKGWESISDEDKKKRIIKATETLQKTSKYGVDLVVNIKNKIKEGLTHKQFRELYPEVRQNFYYELKNGRRWANI